MAVTNIFKTKNILAKAWHTFEEEGFMYCWARFPDCMIKSYIQSIHMKMAKFKKNLAENHLVNITRALGVVLNVRL